MCFYIKEFTSTEEDFCQPSLFLNLIWVEDFGRWLILLRMPLKKNNVSLKQYIEMILEISFIYIVTVKMIIVHDWILDAFILVLEQESFCATVAFSVAQRRVFLQTPC